MAQRAVAALEAAGVPCWIAPRDIDAGENYTQAILEALDAARAIVLVFSSATNESPHVARELETAVSSGRPIIPVRLEQVEPSPSLRYFIGTSQWLDVGGAGDDWSPTLVRAVRTGHRPGHRPRHPSSRRRCPARLQPRALAATAPSSWAPGSSRPSLSPWRWPSP